MEQYVHNDGCVQKRGIARAPPKTLTRLISVGVFRRKLLFSRIFYFQENVSELKMVDVAHAREPLKNQDKQ